LPAWALLKLNCGRSATVPAEAMAHRGASGANSLVASQQNYTVAAPNKAATNLAMYKTAFGSADMPCAINPEIR